MRKSMCFKAMTLLVVLGLIGPSMTTSIYSQTRSSRSTPGTAIFVMAPITTPTIQEKNLTHHEEGIHIELKVPQLKGLSDKQFEKQINKTLLQDAKQRKKQIIKDAKAYQSALNGENLPSKSFEYIENYTLIPSAEPYFVIEQSRYQYSGGAHGITELSYLVLNKATSKVVTLADLFKSNIDYTAIINAYVLDTIHQRQEQGAIYFVGSNGFQSIRQDQPFFINQFNELVIVFNVYEIAPYVAGPQFFNISLESLSDYLK